MKPNKIEFGANGRQMEGWLCTDIDNCDITKPLLFDSDSVEQCYCSHVAEHTESGECQRFFAEVYRILKEGGVFRVVVPAIGLHMGRAHIKDLCCGHGHKIVFSYESLRAMLYAAGFRIENIQRVERSELDNHHKTIGEAKDFTESLRVEATK